MTSKTYSFRGVSSVGLSSKQAFNKLRSDIEEELDKYQGRLSSAGVPEWVRDAFHHASPSAIFPWTSALLLLGDIFLLIVYQLYRDAGARSLAVETSLLFLLLLHNIFLAAWDSRLRHLEMPNRIRHTLHHMEGKQEEEGGSLHAPPSPCISLQWTMRGGRLLPLPTSLLVQGDTLVLRPGHPTPGRCSRTTPNGKEEVLEAGQVFAPTSEDGGEEFFHSPRLRHPARPAKFTLMETPCLTGIRCALENSLKRPVTLFNKEYHAVVFYYMERIVLPLIVVVVVCGGCLRSVYFGWREESGEWAEHLLLRPVLATLPLLPLTLPTCWTILNAAGNARLLASVHSRHSKGGGAVDPFDESEVEEEVEGVAEEVSWWEVRGTFTSLLMGCGGHLWRSANLLQVLGSITALCCVDKKGVLSWPNPTAEKVFFLRAPRGKSGSSEEAFPPSEGPPLPKRPSRPDIKDHIYHPGSQAEVLDLTHNPHSPFGIQFDDPNWKIYSDNLKPLGLAILLNTCNPRAQEHYTTFSDHIACESLYNESAIPVVNKRCLCELAKQIGFADSVVDYYDLQHLLGIFRHVHPEAVQKGALSLNFPRLKMPFPNMTCAILKDLHRGSQQLFSQGTADLILDACYEYWDGSDIRPLTDTDRKRILDFYHRSSLTAHCMGYAYCPLNNSDRLPFNEEVGYIELPAEGRHLLASLDSNSASPRSWDPPCPPTSREVCPLHRHLSSDSLVEQAGEGGSVETSLRQLGNGIFIGMVTMQYQACPDFVQLIEQLDKACIRFVHFSKENELRSRVFSEKMGLESGWNCHISLLSDKLSSEPNKATQTPHHYAFPAEPLVTENRSEITCRHASAPSVVHLETGAIKREDTSDRTEDSSSVSIVLPARVLRAGSLCEGRRDSSSLLSHTTESTEEQSAPVTFDMSNRAKLPKGVENIRPHIACVDNVPLQVSLFTDCSEGATQEMLGIMQEYGEVVCCVGSAANSRNPPLFLQADASIAVEPLIPQLCSSSGPQVAGGGGSSSPLNSLPCCLLFRREDPQVSLHHLIMEARGFTCGVRNCLEFLVCCSLCLGVVQVVCVVFLLPLPLSPTHLLWMNCVELPLLSCSLLLDNPPHLPHSRTLATGKNLKATNKQALVLFCACFCVRFCPSAAVALLSFVCVLLAACSRLRPGNNICWAGDMEAGKVDSADLAESWTSALTVGQNIVSFFLIIYFALISVSYLHRSRPLWKSSPLRTKYWMAAVATVVFLHVFLCVTDVVTQGAQGAVHLVPEYVWLVGGLWPLAALPINEMVRRHEIKVNVRQQKRARLEFCTKLGMNSPF